MKLKIKYKLVAFISSLLFFVILLLSLLILNGIKDYQKKKSEDLLLNEKNLFEQYLSQEIRTGDYLNNLNLLYNPWLNSINASIFDLDGNIKYSFEKNLGIEGINNEEIMIQYALKNKISYIELSDEVYYYSPLKYRNETVAILKLKVSVKDNSDFYYKLKKLFILLGFFSLTMGIILSIICLIPFTNDIKKIIYSVRSIKNGDFKDLKLVKSKDELGELSKGIAFMSDTIENNLIDLKKEKNTLSMAVEKLEVLGKEQKEFIGSVTHEFKTPLTAIKAYAELMQLYEEDTNLMKEASENISKECERLTEMIDNVLSLSALEKYDFEIKKTNIRLKSLIEQICSRMMGKVRKNGLKLECNLKELWIMADEEGLRHILINLIDNAIKYSNPQSIIKIITYEIENEVYIEIIDTGIGISEKDLEKIFEPYYRVESHRSRKGGGTGLGLAFVKKMLERQSGKITVTSEENVGSKFTISFPYI